MVKMLPSLPITLKALGKILVLCKGDNSAGKALALQTEGCQFCSQDTLNRKATVVSSNSSAGEADIGRALGFNQEPTQVEGFQVKDILSHKKQNGWHS